MNKKARKEKVRYHRHQPSLWHSRPSLTWSWVCLPNLHGQSQQIRSSTCESPCPSGSTADKLSWDISEIPPGIFWDRHEQKFLAFSSSLILSTIPPLNSTTEQYHTSIYRGTKATWAFLHLHGISQDLKSLGRTQGMLKTYSICVKGLVSRRVSESIMDAGCISLKDTTELCFRKCEGAG